MGERPTTVVPIPKTMTAAGYDALYRFLRGFPDRGCFYQIVIPAVCDIFYYITLYVIISIFYFYF